MLEIKNLKLTYIAGALQHQALKGVSFKVDQGEFFTLLGPSGCGKTTALRSIAGLETPDSGLISLNGNLVFSGSGTATPTEKRDISMVFQSYAIWPHMTVAENVAFPLQCKGVSSAEQQERVKRALDMVGLEKYSDRSATMLSGGQQQRVALARALVKDAKLILLDEPLSNLDAKLRDQMRLEIRELQKRIGTTAIYVTHDQDEAMSMSDRVALMKDGNLVEIGSPETLYLKPKKRFTAEFLGNAAFVQAKLIDTDASASQFETEFGTVKVSDCNLDRHKSYTLAVRPEHVELSKTPTEMGLDAIIQTSVFSGRLIDYKLKIGTALLPVQVTSRQFYDVGQRIQAVIRPENWIVLAD